ncbi:MAG: BamA/TamA family outer membrane protein [Cyclobacteriaceae bacterium]|nr:BamA/TamA family outer membrane protein [Cyclobacteriaceae bacterium]
MLTKPLVICLPIFTILFSQSLTAQNKNREIGTFPTSIDTTKTDEVVYKNKLLVFPLVALSTETNWVFGVANAYIFKTSKKDPTLRTSTMPSGFLYTLNKQILIAIGANIFLPKEKYIIRFENSFSKFPDKFWGIGNNTPESAKESYTFTQFYINPQLNRKVTRNFFLGVGMDYQDVFDIQYDSLGNFARQEVVGIYKRENYHVLGYAFLLTHDSRNHTYTPNKGSLLRIKLSNFNQHVGSDYNFQGIDIDFRKFIDLKRKRVLAVQGFGVFTFGDVPYRNLAVLGGNSIMRGYYGGRYRDKKFVGTQVEYRFPVYKRFSAVTFGSMGQVASEIPEINFSQFKYAVGAGIRFSVLPRENLNLRFDLAHGDNSLNYYIVLAESF